MYNLTHAIRLLVIPRCETTLSWDQLRSPQVSQFLVKPVQQQIRSSHFSRATLYALISNTLQFSKEVHLYPGNSGASRTRALVCELLAIKLLREYTTRELIDALSYDFHPLQGLVPDPRGNITPGPNWDSSPKAKELPRAARVSTLEVAIRAQAKRYDPFQQTANPSHYTPAQLPAYRAKLYLVIVYSLPCCSQPLLLFEVCLRFRIRVLKVFQVSRAPPSRATT